MHESSSVKVRIHRSKLSVALRIRIFRILEKRTVIINIQEKQVRSQYRGLDARCVFLEIIT